MLNGLCKLGRFREAVGIWQKMVQNGCQPDKFSYATLIHGLCEQGSIEGAYRIYVAMVESGVEADLVTHNSLLDGFCKLGRLDDARKIWNLMEDGKHGRNIVSYNTWIGGLCRAKLAEEAISVWTGMKVNAFCDPDSITCGTLIHGLCEIGCVNRALVVLEEMEEGGGALDVVAYSSIISGLCAEGREKLEEAVCVFDRMLKRGCKPSTHTYNSLINAFCRAFRFEDAFADIC